MSGMYDQFRTSKDTETNGLWVNYGAFMVRVARAGGANKAFSKKMEELTRPYRRAINTGTMDEGVADDLLRQGYAETVILDWKVKQGEDYVKGIESPDGSILPVTVENIMATLKNLPELFADLREQASAMTLFRESLREEAAGN